MLKNLRGFGFFLIVSMVLAGCSNPSTTPPENPPPDDSPPETSACNPDVEMLENLEVTAGTQCFLVSTVIQGDVMVAAGAELNAIGITVGGTIQGQGAASVALDGGIVAGGARLEGGEVVDITDSNFGGNVQIVGNSGEVSLSEISVEGDLQVSQNTGGVLIDSSPTITGNLQCEQNDPAPEGVDNIVTGSKEGQCSGL